MKLTDSKKGLIVKALLEKNLYQVGLDFELDKHYKDAAAVRNAVYRVWQAAQKDPERYALTQETIDSVSVKMKERTPTAVRNQQITLREKIDADTNKDFKELVLDGRKKAFGILMKKLDRVSKNNKSIDDLALGTIAQAFGIIFDKAQIISGEATENVAVLAKIDSSMKPEDAITAVLKMREGFQAEKERKKK